MSRLQPQLLRLPLLSAVAQRAGHEGVRLVRLHHRVEQRLRLHGERGEVDHLGDAPCEVDRSLDGQPPLQSLVRPIQLGVRLLQQGTPKLILVLCLDVDQLAVPGGQSVVHADLDPLAKPEESESENSAVVGVESLARGNNAVKHLLVVREVGQCSKEPAVPDLPLVYVKPGRKC